MNRVLRRVVILTILSATAAGASPFQRPLRPVPPPDEAAKIVNGIATSGLPSVVALLFEGVATDCSATLVGCETVLSAAHCFCIGGDFPSCGTPDPEDWKVFAQHGGIYDVESISIAPDYAFAQGGDLAVLKLTRPVEGIAPSPLNLVGRVAPGSQGLIAGFGSTQDPETDAGIKRVGLVSSVACQVVPDATHVCWDFADPVGPAGEDSNTCRGDSGGPLFFDFGVGPVVAGVTSGGNAEDCLAPEQSFDADVFGGRAWIQSVGGTDLGNTTCGDLPSAGGPGAPILAGEGTLDADTPQAGFFAELPAGHRMRVALNGEDGEFLAGNDFDFYVKRDGDPTPIDFDCGSQRPGTFEFCEIASPAAGRWNFLVDRAAGEGDFQLTVTFFEGAATGCVPDATTICIDDEPGDRRFRATLSYDTVLGDAGQGDARALALSALGVTQGGLFTFFDPKNPEMIVKVLDFCEFNDHYWVFYAATTNVGFELTVEDTLQGPSKTYVNPDLRVSVPMIDTEAFATCP